MSKVADTTARTSAMPTFTLPMTCDPTGDDDGYTAEGGNQTLEPYAEETSPIGQGGLKRDF